MASPFSIFRQNQWIMLAGMGVLLMIAFVIVPSVQMLMDTGRGRGNVPVVVEFKSIRDKLDEAQVQDMMQRRTKMLRLLASIRETVQMADPDLQRLPAEFRPMMVQRFAPMFGMYAQSVFGPDSEQAVVMTHLLVKKADELGVLVSNAAINDFLKRQMEGKMDLSELRKICDALALSDKQLFEDLRYELKAIEARQLVLEEPAPPDFERFMRGQAQFDGITGVTPEERYEYFERTSSRVALEVLPVKVETLAAKEKEPTEAELRAYFEKHKDKPQGNELEPGFKVPYQSIYEYVLAEPARVDELSAKQPVTDAEIVKYYEANKDLEFEDRAAALENPLNTPEKRPEEIVPPAKDEKKEEKPAAKDEKKEPEKKDEKKEPEKKPEAKKCGEEEGEEASDSCQDAAKKDEKKPEEKGDAKKPEEKKGDEKAPPAAPQLPAAPPAKKYKPLDEALKNEIRKRLEREGAIRSIEDSLIAIRTDVMRKYGSQYYAWQTDKASGKATSAEPPRPDLKAIAAKAGLKYGLTKPMSQLTAKDNPPLGTSFVGSSQPVKIENDNMFVFRAFSGLQTFFPEYATDDVGSRMAFWKIEEIEPHVPKFEEVKDLVLKAWKTEKAREQAEALAKKFVTDGKGLESLTKALGATEREISVSLSLPPDIQTVLPEDKPAGEATLNPAAKPLVEALGQEVADLVFTTRPFSWLLGPMLGSQRPQAPRLNTVDGLDSIDDAFMKTVFGLKEGELGYAWNRPKSILYLVRVKQNDPAQKFAFLRFGNKEYMPQAAEDKFSFIQGRVQELVSEFGVHWVRDPRDRRR